MIPQSPQTQKRSKVLAHFLSRPFTNTVRILNAFLYFSNWGFSFVTVFCICSKFSSFSRRKLSLKLYPINSKLYQSYRILLCSWPIRLCWVDDRRAIVHQHLHLIHNLLSMLHCRALTKQTSQILNGPAIWQCVHVYVLVCVKVLEWFDFSTFWKLVSAIDTTPCPSLIEYDGTWKWLPT